MKLGGWVYQEGETRIPLTGNLSTTTPDGREVAVEGLDNKGREGRATISVTVDQPARWPFAGLGEWMVLDDAGDLHRTRPVGGESSEGVLALPPGGSSRQVLRQEYEWTLPRGRTAVALVSSGYWERVESLGEFIIEIPTQ